MDDELREALALLRQARPMVEGHARDLGDIDAFGVLPHGSEEAASLARVADAGYELLERIDALLARHPA